MNINLSNRKARAGKIFFSPSLGGGDRPPRPPRGSAAMHCSAVTEFRCFN